MIATRDEHGGAGTGGDAGQPASESVHAVHEVEGVGDPHNPEQRPYDPRDYGQDEALTKGETCFG